MWVIKVIIGIDTDNTLTEVQKELNIAAYNYAKSLGKNWYIHWQSIEHLCCNFTFRNKKHKNFRKTSRFWKYNKLQNCEDIYNCILKWSNIDEEN